MECVNSYQELTDHWVNIGTVDSTSRGFHLSAASHIVVTDKCRAWSDTLIQPQMQAFHSGFCLAASKKNHKAARQKPEKPGFKANAHPISPAVSDDNQLQNTMVIVYTHAMVYTVFAATATVQWWTYFTQSLQLCSYYSNTQGGDHSKW